MEKDVKIAGICCMLLSLLAGTPVTPENPVPTTKPEVEKQTEGVNPVKTDGQEQKKAAAKTGDNAQIPFWMILMAGSAMTVVMTETYRKRNQDT